MTTVEKALQGKAFIKEELYNAFTQEDADEIWKRAGEKLGKIYAEHQGLPKGVAAHTDGNIFPSAAIYLSMKEKDPEKAFEVMRVSMKANSEKAGASLAKSARFPGFKNVFYPKKKGEFAMDITQCPYHTYLTELGCPEINRLFCDNDIYCYGNIPGLEFIRTKTIGNGDELCDFRLRLK